jgi:hypothetical protein
MLMLPQRRRYPAIERAKSFPAYLAEFFWTLDQSSLASLLFVARQRPVANIVDSAGRHFRCLGRRNGA